MKYRKKPVVIEARQLTSDNLPEVRAWVADGRSYPSVNAVPPVMLFINTLEGVMTATEGDYIIRGVKGEFYPCKPDIFAATYERVED